MSDRELSNKLSSGELTQIKLNGTASTDIVPTVGENDAKYGLKVDVAANTAFIADPKPVIQFAPQSIPPAHVEGQLYYDETDETFKAQGPFAGVAVEVGHTMHIHIINNSGAIIEKGMAVRHNGVALGIVQIEKALADSFVNAEVFGVTQHEIGIGERGAIATFGQIRDLDTSALTPGVPLYLSDTVAGTYTPTKPAILSQVGGVVTSDALTGELFVSIVSNKNVPTVFAGMQGQTVGNNTYSATLVPQDIDDYLAGTVVVMEATILTGVLTLSNNGQYRQHFTADISFPSSTSTRTVFLELYDITNAAVIYTYAKNIPRDAITDAFSFSFPFSGLANGQYKMRIASSVAISVTVDAISFDIQSISIV